MSYNIYAVKLQPPTDVDLQGRSDLAALFDGPTSVRVRAQDSHYAEVKGLAMVPWAYVQPFKATAVLEPRA